MSEMFLFAWNKFGWMKFKKLFRGEVNHGIIIACVVVDIYPGKRVYLEFCSKDSPGMS